MGKTYCGLILKTAYDRVGDTSTMTALGKSFLEWVKLALADAKEISVADYDGTDDFPRIVKPFIKKDCDYIVVLFSDTPLVTGKTVAAAVEEAYAGKSETAFHKLFVLRHVLSSFSRKIFAAILAAAVGRAMFRSLSPAGMSPYSIG